MERQHFVYILTNQPRGTLYLGATNNLIRRVAEHRSRQVSGFTRKYFLTRLVYFEAYREMLVAFEREYRLKRWRRAWKIELVERVNPEWRDLYPGLLSSQGVW
ncbi:MAG: GIY-YIG nuclease family protein [Gammaproteobacteria bacterium]|jgi:putative endonuclease|nr:GIY-YIG nuclease family protein [Gammaproteobacteria bacterium]